jgi:cytochrome c peroxidase
VAFLPWLLALILLVCVDRVSLAKPEDGSLFRLSTDCPSAFHKTPGGLCQLKSSFYPMGGAGAAWKTLPYVRELSQGLNPRSIDLGRLLFFDPILSGTGTQSCADCHQPDLGFADGRPVSIGAHGNPVTRSAPSLWNVAFFKRYFWDGRARSLEEQTRGPLFSPSEMAHSEDGLKASLNGNPVYRRLFAEAYPEAKKGIEIGHVTRALADFERTLVSLDSPYDRYIRGDFNALNAAEVEGFNVFRSFVSRCSECHTPPLFTNGQFAVIGVPNERDQHGDDGVGALTQESSQKGAFKVPSLRNAALTAPYMHRGQFATLDDVMLFYNRGGGRSDSPRNAMIHWHVRPMGLDPGELETLTLFLRTLTDVSNQPVVPLAVPSGLRVNFSKKELGIRAKEMKS